MLMQLVETDAAPGLIAFHRTPTREPSLVNPWTHVRQYARKIP